MILRTLPIALAFLFASQLRMQGWVSYPEVFPMDQLIQNTNEFLKRNPDNAEATYTLARIHYIAFASDSPNLQAYLGDDQRLARIAPMTKFDSRPSAPDLVKAAERRAAWDLQVREIPTKEKPGYAAFQEKVAHYLEEFKKGKWLHEPGTVEFKIDQLGKALMYFQKAQELSPKNSLYQLGKASLLEQASVFYRGNPEAKVPEIIRELTPAKLREEYRKARELGLTDKLKDSRADMGSENDFVSYEAGSAYIRLAEKDAQLTSEEKEVLDEIKKGRNALDDVAGWATPIMLSKTAVAGIDELLDPETFVHFPVQGWGWLERCSWIKPDAALLVWNPSGSGRIQSGAQLFGGYTWELFWKNGYEPLCILDVNNDGSLTGVELEKIAAWEDRNSNGVSDVGEVIPLDEYGVTALSTQFTGTDDIHLTNPAGVTFKDGRVLPTWDWMVKSKVFRK